MIGRSVGCLSLLFLTSLPREIPGLPFLDRWHPKAYAVSRTVEH